MATLHNRLCKAEFYSDPDLLSLPRDVRQFYRDLWHVAEDAGSLEDSPFGWKILLYPSPLDADVTVDAIAGWRDVLIDAGKLVPYQADGKRYLFLTNFLRHQNLTNPKRCELPLPPWVTLQEHPTDNRKRSYKVTGTIGESSGVAVTTLAQEPSDSTAAIGDSSRNACTTVEQQLSNGTSTPEPNRTEREEEQDLLSTADAADEAASPDDFDLFWDAYPRKDGSKKNARRAYRGLSVKKRRLALDVARTMQDLVARGQGPGARNFIPLPTTFIRGEVWDTWTDGPPANWGGPGRAGPRPATNSYADELTDYDREFLSGSYGEPTEGAS